MVQLGVLSLHLQVFVVFGVHNSLSPVECLDLAYSGIFLVLQVKNGTLEVEHIIPKVLHVFLLGLPSLIVLLQKA